MQELSRKHILMVDDVTTNLKCAAEVLQPYYQLSMAKSGKQALKFLEKNHPDLILLDIKMPEMDGYEVMDAIRLNPSTANIPIIFLTADTQQESEIRGIQLGAMDFITKPFEEESMLGRIEKVLQMEDLKKNLLPVEAEAQRTGGSFTEENFSLGFRKMETVSGMQFGNLDRNSSKIVTSTGTAELEKFLAVANQKADNRDYYFAMVCFKSGLTENDSVLNTCQDSLKQNLEVMIKSFCTAEQASMGYQESDYLVTEIPGHPAEFYLLFPGVNEISPDSVWHQMDRILKFNFSEQNLNCYIGCTVMGEDYIEKARISLYYACHIKEQYHLFEEGIL